MRRILYWLPALALVACQADTPTTIDEPIQAEKTLSDTKLTFLGAGVFGDFEFWGFLVPSETRPPTIVDFLVRRTENTWRAVPPSSFASATYGDETGDGIPDLRVYFIYDVGGVIPVPCSVWPFTEGRDAAWVMLALWYGDPAPTADYVGTVRVQVDCPLS